MTNHQQPAAERPAETESRAETSTVRIQQLNDQFRQTLRGGRATVTAGVFNLGPIRISEIMAQVRAFDRFTPDNDPYGEHDFGAFEDCGDRFFWKIDYYDKGLNGGSPDPSDPDQTTRVLTVMLASEY